MNANHPWRRGSLLWPTPEQRKKLKEARKEAKRRYERGDVHKSIARDRFRRNKGLNLSAPVTPHEEVMRLGREAMAQKRIAQKAFKELGI